MASEYQSSLRDSVGWLMNKTESLWVAVVASCRQTWDDLQNAFYTHLTPGERFGRDAVYVFLVGTVPAFLAGSTSAALLFGIIPGFIGGLGLIVAFSHAQASRSRERRAKVWTSTQTSAQTFTHFVVSLGACNSLQRTVHLLLMILP